MLLEKTKNLANLLMERIRSFDRDLLEKFPVETYIKYLEAYPRISHYKYISQEVETYCQRIMERSSKEALSVYHKLLLVTLISRNIDRVKNGPYPEDVKTLFARNFELILTQIEKKAFGDEFYNYPRDRLMKDLAVCNLRLIPAGAEKINVCRMPRRWLLRKGISQFLQGALFVLFELRGFKPLYYYHMDSNDPDLMAEFNYDGWCRFYKRVAALLEINRDIKGICSIPWFLDPQLEKISPRLNYLREFFTQNGGRVFYSGSDDNGIASAIAKSPTRRRLYEEGKYMPANYMGIWPRKKLIEWAKKNPQNLEGNRTASAEKLNPGQSGKGENA
jgi:hypothetical protein